MRLDELIVDLEADTEVATATVWLQSADDEEGANLIPVVDVKLLGDKMSPESAAKGAREGDPIIRFDPKCVTISVGR
jgi:hypothetical protein